ncbi:MAG: pitrilysin family protein [Phycisphaerales bacterium]|nr:pitrilysin family protein [Phycisphaerales bacterium]
MPSPIFSTTLDCGMPLIVERIPGVASASLQWLVPAGAAHDPADRTGLCAIIAEMLMRGCGTLSSREQADELDRLGILRATEVGTQYVRLNATFVGANADACLPMLVQMVRQPRFDTAALEPSRKLSQQSLAGLADNPQERAGVLLTSRHAAPPVNRSVLGTEEGLAAVTHADVVRAWERQCRPRGSILAIAGDVDAASITTTLNRLLGDWSGTAPSITLGSSPTRGTYFHEPDESNQTHIFLAHEAPAESSPDAPLERMHNAVLSGGTSARLFTEVREKRALCYSVSASYSSDRLYGRVVGYVGTTPEKAQLSLDVMLDQLRGACGDHACIQADELARAQIGYRARLVSSGESTRSRAATLASDWHRLDRARSLDELVSETASVTLEALNGYARRRTMGPVTIVTVGPAPLKA